MALEPRAAASQVTESCSQASEPAQSLLGRRSLILLLARRRLLWLLGIVRSRRLELRLKLLQPGGHSVAALVC